MFNIGQQIRTIAIQAYEWAWKNGGAIAYRNGINFFLGQVAKQSAEYIATGGKGQKPMFLRDPNYWDKLGDQVLGEWIEQTAKSVTGFTGRSLCDPIDPTIKFNMLVGFDPKYQEMMFNPDMRCSWSMIKSRYKELSKKKFIDFSAELNEGAAGRMNAELTAKIQGASLIGDAKGLMLKGLDKIGVGEEELNEMSQRLKKISDGVEKVSDAVAAALKKAWQENIAELEAQKKAVLESDLVKKAQKCLGSDKLEFCKWDFCRKLCPNGENLTEGQCIQNYREYQQEVEKINNFAKQIGAVADLTLIKAKEVLDYFADIQPVEKNLSMEDLNREYNPEASDVAVMFQVQSQLFNKQAQMVENSKFMQGLTGDINRLSSTISDLTLTPSSFIDESARQAVKSSTAGPLQYTGVAAADAIGIFTNTLINKLLKQVFEKGLNPSVSPEIAERTTAFLSDAGEFNSPPRAESEVLYGDLAVAAVKKGGEMTIYDEFAVCPDDKKYALPTNCLMDSKLARAAEEGLTLEEAIKKGLLNGDQVVGKANDYTSLLSWPNVKKLRKIRMVPLGLEIAADKLFHTELGELGDVEVSLNEILGGFNDLSSPFYHLVDPNWILKASTYQCDLMGYTSIPLAASAQRQETCVDLKDCIHEDENEGGECDTWAYCTREKNAWRFDGDACDRQYASCRTYQRTKDKKQFSYLTDTLDFTGCNQNNAGCSWYCSQWDDSLVEGGKWTCEEPGVSTKFDHEETCALFGVCLEEGGCLCTQGTNSCLVSENESNCDFPTYVTYSQSDNVKFFNNKAATCPLNEEGCREYIRTASGLGTNMVFNGSFESDSDFNDIPDGWEDPQWEGTETINSDEYNSGYFSYKFTHSSADGTNDWTGRWQLVPVVPEEEYTASVWVKIESAPDDFTVNYYFDDDGQGYEEGHKGKTTVIIDGSDNDWQKHIQTFVVPSGINYVWLAPIMYGNGIVYVDDLKLETGNQATVYKEYGQVNKVYLKNLLTCQADEAGCELYTPVNGDQSISGIAGTQDKCSYQCLGYNTFQEMPTVFTASSCWINFIPSTAKLCSLPGCDSFTNLETEKIGYFSYTRQCVKIDGQNRAVVDHAGKALTSPDSGLCQYYYTWVGSENTGYQLKKYFLEKNSSTGGPENFFSEPDPAWGDCENSDDAFINPHCKQFYDSNGNIYYRLYKNTVACSPDCASYRRSADQSVRTALVAESELCSKQESGCREYKGSSGDNIRKIFSDDFESGEKNSRWGTKSFLSSESVNYPGHSLAVDGEISPIDLSVSDLVWGGKTYFVSFWVKAEKDKITVKFSSLPKQEKTNLIKDEWQEVKFGPFYFDEEPSDTEILSIEVSKGNLFVDNFTVTEIQDNLYLIKNSWTTPCACDTLANHISFATNAQNCTAENTAGVSLVGCQVYQDRAGQVNYLKSFSKLCSSTVVGCEALIDTQNSDSPLMQTFNSGGATEDDVIVPADEMVYLVNDENNKCDSKYQGCEKFGRPVLDVDGNVVSYTDVYLVNDPDLYVNTPILCLNQDVGCEQYEGPYYFKDPGEKLCEYRQNVIVGIDQTKTGWFRINTDEPCYYEEDGTPYGLNGVTYGIRSSRDDDYEGWAGLCPDTQSGCTKFIDPLGRNLIGNANFELGKANGLPDGFIRNVYEPTDVVTSGLIIKDAGNGAYIYNGEKSYGINVRNEDDWYGLIYEDGVKVRPNAKYEVSAHVKTDSLGEDTSVILGVVCHNVGHTGGNGHFTYIDSDESFVNESDHDWTRIWRSFVTSADADHCHLQLFFNDRGSGTAYFDGLGFFEQDSNQGTYYYLNNNRLDKSSCQGMAGLKDGCVLFNDTSQGEDSLIYDAASTYADSLNNDDLAVSVVNAEDDRGDANVVLKVRRDRVCGEWLTCIGSREIWDDQTGTRREICEFIGRCDELIGKGENGLCGHYVFYSDPQPLSEAIYKARNVSWSGMDYSGYSLFNMYPVELLFASEETGNKLTYTNNNGNNVGVDGGGAQISKTCQIFPEKDSPFPQDELDNNKNLKNNYYQDVNVCFTKGGSDYSDYSDCQCSYIKAEYSGMTRYYNGGNIPNGICLSGNQEKSKWVDGCSGDSDCGTGGYCAAKSKQTTYMGLRGFCLEKDESRPAALNACLTWWPGAGAGDADIYQTYTVAGYTPATDRTIYCEEKTLIQADFPAVVDYYCDRHVDANGDDKCEDKGVIALPDDLRKKIKKSEIAKIEIDLMANDDENVCSLHWDDAEVLTDVDGDGVDDSEDWWACGGYDHQGDNNPCTHTSFSDGCSCRDGGCCVNVEAQFDEDNYLSGFLFKVKDRSSAGGSAGWRNAKIYLKNRCTYLVKIPTDSQGLVKGAYTDRLWENSGYSLSSIYWRDKYEPYGATDLNNISANRLVVANNDATVSPTVHSRNSLQSLFAYASEEYSFNSATMLYSTKYSNGWNITSSASSADAPRVASVDVSDCDENGNCKMSASGEITINGKTSGNITRTQSFPATMKFFAWADSDHMPIREIIVDWDLTGASSVYSVAAKNHMQIKDCNNTKWGRSLGQACVEKYFQFTYTYTCEGENSPGWSSSEKACVFQPKVYVKDNWDWCTNGVYAATSSCNTYGNAAVAYNGKIIVKP